MAKKVVERMDGKAIVITGGAGPMTTAIAIRDASSFLRDLVKDPENADRLLDFCVDCNLKWIEYNQKSFRKSSCVYGRSSNQYKFIESEVISKIFKAVHTKTVEWH